MKLVRENIEFKRGGQGDIQKNMGIGSYGVIHNPTADDWLSLPSGYYVVTEINSKAKTIVNWENNGDNGTFQISEWVYPEDDKVLVRPRKSVEKIMLFKNDGSPSLSYNTRDPYVQIKTIEKLKE